MDCMILMETERVASNLKDRPIMNTEDQEGGGGGDNCLTPPLKMSSPRNCSGAVDDQSVDTKLSGDSGGTTSIAVISPRRKDPDRIKKDREREERVRQARERLEEERKKKLIELQEQQRQAQENREKQLELRRKKIEDLRRREMERRAEVEKRRRERETAEKSRRETLLQKAEERVARYEAWKRGGQKGGRGHVLGFGSGTPRDICRPLERSRRSSSHSALLRHSPEGSDSDYSFRPQRRSLSACSTVRRHCCVDLNRSGPPPGCAMPATKQLSVSTSVLYHKRHSDFASSGALNVSTRPDSLLALNTIPEGRRSVLAPSTPATRHKSVMSLSTPSPGTTSVKLRENKSPRKPRPASVASSMPSFVGADGPKTTSPRSHSTDRLARDRPRSRGAVSASRADDKDAEEKKATPDKPGVKISRKTLDRLSTPRQAPAKDGDSKESSSTPRRETTLVRKHSLREKTTKEAGAAAKSQQQQTPKEKAVRPPKPKDSPNKTPRPAPPSTSSPLTIDPTAAAASPRAESPAASSSPGRVLSPTPAGDEDGGSSASQARVTPTPADNPLIEITQPASSPAPEEKPATVETPQPSSTPTPMDRSTAEASPSRSTPTPSERSTADITAEEYKARLAEKRRQAREKAEREAEEERRRQEEEERLEQERQRQEEEEEKRREEEATRLAAEARKAEEERLQKAIEAEEARRAEEAARLEQERLAKEEAERKAKEEAERVEQEKLEKARREEEERLERKKRLEMIMKRVKTDNAGEGGKDTPRSIGSSPVRTVAAAPAPAPSDNTAPAEPAPNTSTQPTPAAVAAAAETEERKQSVDSSADESHSSPGAPLSPAVSSSPVPFTTQETPSIPQSSSQENVLEVKEDSTPASSRSQSPVVPALSTPRGSMSEAGSSDRPKFKSPLLQKLVEGRDDAGASGSGDTPKFKSPLLQNLLSKTRVGARMGLAQDYSRSSPDLSQVEQGGDRRSSNASPSSMAAMAMSSSMIDMDTANSSPSAKEASKMSSSMIDMNSVNSASKEELNRNEEKEVDTSEDNSSSSHSSPTHLSRKTRVSNGDTDRQTESPPPAQDSSSVTMETSASVETSAAPEAVTVGSSSSSSVLWNAQDSGVSLGPDELLQSSVPSMEVSLNGHTPPLAAQGQDLADSSISVQSVDSVTPALTDSAAGSEPAPQSPTQEHSSEDKNFEELIDLSLKNNSTKMNIAEDLVNFHKLEEGSGETDTLPPPIIAFEDTSMRKHQDVSDLLS